MWNGFIDFLHRPDTEEPREMDPSRYRYFSSNKFHPAAPSYRFTAPTPLYQMPNLAVHLNQTSRTISFSQSTTKITKNQYKYIRSNTPPRHTALSTKLAMKFKKTSPVKTASMYKYVRNDRSPIRQVKATVSKVTLVNSDKQVKSTLSRFKFVKSNLTPTKAAKAAVTPALVRSRFKVVKKVSVVKPVVKRKSVVNGSTSRFKYIKEKSPGLKKRKRSIVGTRRYKVDNRYNTGTKSELRKPTNGYSVQQKSRFKWIRLSGNSPIRISPLAVRRRWGWNCYRANGKNVSLVQISGVLYRSTKAKLQRSGVTNSGLKSPARVVISKMTAPQAVVVRGVRFIADSNGRTLKRDSNPVTPSRMSQIYFGGRTFRETAPGILKCNENFVTKNIASRAVNRSIYHLVNSKLKHRQFCLFYNKFGKCRRFGEGTCPYIHDKEKVAVCKRLIKDGVCNVKECILSHTLCRDKMPVCEFFLRGKCSHDDCIYRHVNVNPDADICQQYLQGYCPLKDSCRKWHVDVCPHYRRKGQCPNGDGCPLARTHNRRVRQRAEEDTSSDERSDDSPIPEESPIKTFVAGPLPQFIPLEAKQKIAENGLGKIGFTSAGAIKIKPSFLV